MKKHPPLAIGNTFGRWTIIGGPVLLRAYPKARERATHWYCQCSCGVTKYRTATTLRSGDTQSCGCLWREKHVQREDDQFCAHLGDIWDALIDAHTSGHTTAVIE